MSWFGVSYVPSRNELDLVGISFLKFSPMLQKSVFIESAISKESRIVSPSSLIDVIFVIFDLLLITWLVVFHVSFMFPSEESLVSIVYYRVHHGWAWKNFQNRSSQMDGERYFEFDFCR